MLKGIDVSTYQGNIDWEKAKKSIDFAIIRCGYGGDYKAQDDDKFAKNVAECEKLNIPFGVYLYSYAKSETMIDSEVTHALRLIGNHKPFCVYIDMEDNSTAGLGKAALTALAKRFCEAVKAKGFKVGVYANQNWFRNYLDVKALSNAGYSIWCAKYADEEPIIDAKFDIWQYSSSGSVDGISGRVDMNNMYNDIRNIATKDTTGNRVQERIHIVKAGETLSVIAAKYYKMDWKKIAEYNGIKPPYTIYPGQEIIVSTSMMIKDEPKAITVGSTVRVKKGAKDYNGNGLANFIYNRNHKVSELKGNRAVITYTGVVVCAVHKDNLYLV